MVRRRAAALAAALAAASCVPEVEQDSPEALVFAAFDPGTGQIPLPNDLALANLPPSGPVRTALEQVIRDGGFRVSQTQGVVIPFVTLSFQEATGAYRPETTPPAIDVATVTPSTVAFVQYDVTPPLVVDDFIAVYGSNAADPNDLVIVPRPESGAFVAGGRYVVALRGGANGVKTTDGRPVNALGPIALIAPNVDLTIPANTPPGITAPELVALEGGTTQQPLGLRDFYALPLEWNPVDSPPPGPPFEPPWTPAPASGLVPPFDAVALVFPHEEIASIQTFEMSAVFP
jgi:hypothetical protein